MHIVHTEASCGWGGQEIRILTESQGTLERGHRVTLLVNADSPIEREARRLGIAVEAAPLQGKSLRGIGHLRRWLRTNRPDVVNTHSSTDAWLMALARPGLDIPIVRTRHISAPVPSSPLSNWLYLRGADRVVTTGKALRDVLRQRFPGNDEHFVSVPTGIDLQRYSLANVRPRDAVRAEAGIPAEATVIGIAATLRTWKGHDYLVAAFDTLADQRDDIYLAIVGDGPMRPHLETLTAACRNAARIRMLGHSDNVENLLGSMDVFALPSYANEGVPQAILQAMAMELPVVTTRVGAISEAVVDGETGLQVATKDSSQLAAALARLLDDRDLARRLGRAGRARVEQLFSRAAMIDSMLDVFARATHTTLEAAP